MTEPPLYSLSGAAIVGPLGPVLAPTDLELRDRRVVALVGPVGSGKSTLLRRLSGRPPSEGWSVAGSWCFRGAALEDHPLREVAWVPQLSHAPAHAMEGESSQATARARLDAALFCGAQVLLLDEPTRGLTSADRLDLERRLRAHASKGTAIVITHELDFARRVADEVCLLCDGEVVSHRPAAEFFDQPQDELEEQFVRYGTCSRPAPTPTLPRHFHWLEEDILGGMGRPGLLRDLDDDLFSIAYAGVTLLVSLTEDPLPTNRLRPFGLEGRHFPIPDMRVPRMSDAVALCHDLQRAIGRGEVVVVHCHAGLGRTGTILACLAVQRGLGAAEAIERVRAVARGSIQTEGQEAFVHAFEARR